jgi:hypothetical protein
MKLYIGALSRVLQYHVEPALDATATDDQDDNERLVRYLECQPGSKKEQINGFVNMVMRRIRKGCSVCHVVFVFQQNTDWVDEMHIEQRLSSDFDDYDRDPRKSDNAEKPWFFFWPNVPGSAAEQHALNEGGDSGGDYVAGILTSGMQVPLPFGPAPRHLKKVGQ